MISEMEINNSSSSSEGIEEMEEMEMEIEVLPSMWPEDIDSEKPYNVERPAGDGEQDMLEEVTIRAAASAVDFHHLKALTSYTDRGSHQMSHLMRHWEHQQANAVRLLREELDILSRQREEVELKKLEILEHFQFEEDNCKRPISILDKHVELYGDGVPRKKFVDFVVRSDRRVELAAESDTVAYWKARAANLEKLLEASVHREQILVEKLEENMKELEGQGSPVEELSQILKRADNFLHFVLQNAPVVIGHQVSGSDSSFCRGNHASQTDASNNVSRDKIATIWRCEHGRDSVQHEP